MKKIVNQTREVWLGKHNILGPFIYDEKNQNHLDSDKKIRIFVIKEKKTDIFHKDIFKQKIIKLKDISENSLKKSINDYVKIFSKKRVTHCYSCQNYLDNVDFSICSTCKWIRCECSACGCQYEGFMKGYRYED